MFRVLILVLALFAFSDNNLNGHSSAHFTVPSGSTAVRVDAVDSSNNIWATDEVPVHTTYVYYDLSAIKSQLPLGGYPDLTLVVTVTTNGCSCSYESTVAILD